ncbi:MAG: hypothetical protein FJ086_00005 [Deltaproteobacteria bacterium]|nr:hypothetical protein [Deltaproteobacteria bacterium]
MRIALLLGATVVRLGVCSDRVLSPREVADGRMWYPLLGAAPLLMPTLGATWLPFFAERLQSLLAGTVLLMWVGVTGPLLRQAPPSPPILLFGGVILLLVSVFALLRLSFMRSLVLAVAIFAGTAYLARHHQLDGNDGVGMLYFEGLIALVGVVGIFLAETCERRLYVEEQLLAAERDRSERPMLNILPASIAARLKAREDIIADGLPDVGVLFADLVGFTRLAVELGPEETVRRLNGLFTTFDALATTHGVEKIKTVGDAYMVASGAPEASDGHLERLADMAIAMRDAVAAAWSGQEPVRCAWAWTWVPPSRGSLAGARSATTSGATRSTSPAAWIPTGWRVTSTFPTPSRTASERSTSSTNAAWSS